MHVHLYIKSGAKEAIKSGGVPDKSYILMKANKVETAAVQGPTYCDTCIHMYTKGVSKCVCMYMYMYMHMPMCYMYNVYVNIASSLHAFFLLYNNKICGLVSKTVDTYTYKRRGNNLVRQMKCKS